MERHYLGTVKVLHSLSSYGLQTVLVVGLHCSSHSGSRKHSGDVALLDLTSSHFFSGSGGMASTPFESCSWCSWCSWSPAVPKSGLGAASIAAANSGKRNTTWRQKSYWKNELCISSILNMNLYFQIHIIDFSKIQLIKIFVSKRNITLFYHV